jgi:hypothetical protein
MSPHAVRVIVKPTTKHSCTAWYPVYFYIQNNSTGHQVTGFTLLSAAALARLTSAPSWACPALSRPPRLSSGGDCRGHPGRNEALARLSQIPQRRPLPSCESSHSRACILPGPSSSHPRDLFAVSRSFDVKGTETNGLPCHFCHF